MLAASAAGACWGFRCKPGGQGGGGSVFKYQPLGSDAAPLQSLLRAFEAKERGLSVTLEALPNASDVAHQFYLTALEGHATDFDVYVVDAIWISEFARAGWAADLSETFPQAVLEDAFLPGPATAARHDGRTYAVPWFVDVGLLYYRSDWIPEPPRTWPGWLDAVRSVRSRQPDALGYVWQGKQYEGLSCNVFEALWAHGGDFSETNGWRIDTPESVAALEFLRRLLTDGLSPDWVTSATEEETRRPFGAGRSVLMRNWPYAHAEGQREGSTIRGKFAVTSMPSISSSSSANREGAGALGGWFLAVNAHVSKERRQRAAELIEHLTSLNANRMLALDYARNPARRDAYEDAQLKARAPFITGLAPMLEAARPRPMTPYYNLLADALQSEFSAAVSGIRSAASALQRAQSHVDRILGAGQGRR